MASLILATLSAPLKRLRSDHHSTRSTKRSKSAEIHHSRRDARDSVSEKRHLETANDLPSEDFVAQHVAAGKLDFKSKGDEDFTITLRTSAELSGSEFLQCYNLVELTSSEDYKASVGGWNEVHKKKEMKDKDMRYLLVRRKDVAATTTSQADIIAFASFMLTIEENELVIYVYEIHLHDIVRRSGLGKHLMCLVEHIGTSTKMQKSMLTVFTRNENAERFYRRLGYTEDEISPKVKKLRRGKVLKPDYFIMSKALG